MGLLQRFVCTPVFSGHLFHHCCATKMSPPSLPLAVSLWAALASTLVTCISAQRTTDTPPSAAPTPISERLSSSGIPAGAKYFAIIFAVNLVIFIAFKKWRQVSV